MGQYAVAMVTLNRARHEKSKVCETVFRRRQFSWANTGVQKAAGGWSVSPKWEPRDEDAWVKAKIIAATSLSGKMPDFTKGADHYHTLAIFPKWAMEMSPTKIIGHHIFYSSKSQDAKTGKG